MISFIKWEWRCWKWGKNSTTYFAATSPYFFVIIHVLDIFTVHEKQFTICFFVILVPTEPFQNDISCKYNGCMAYHCTITTALEFRTQFQERFWCLEKAFNWPAVPVNTHNFCVFKWSICAQKIEAFTFFITVAYKYNLL